MSKISAVKVRKQKRANQSAPISEKPTNEQLTIATTYQEDLLSKIDSINEEERHWAIASLARLVTEEPPIFSLVVERSDVISRTVKRIFDPDSSVRVTASGLIRNLTSVGDLIVCQKIVSADCLSSVFSLLKQFQENPTDDGDQQELVVNSLNILSNLSEFEEHVLVKILECNLINQVLFDLLKPARLQIALATAELLHVITDDYLPARQQITENSTLYLKATVANMQNDLYLRVLAAGILFNLDIAWDSSWESLVVKAIIPALSQSLDIDTLSYMCTLVPLIGTETYPMNLMVEGNPDTPLTQELRKVRNSLTTQITALEILTNILVSNDDTSEQLELENEVSMANNSLSSKTQTLQTVVKHLVSSEVLNKVLVKCDLIPSSEIPSGVIQDKNPGIFLMTALSQIGMLIPYLKLFHDRQFRALSSLNNILLVLPLPALVKSSHDVTQLWNRSFNLCGQFFSDSPFRSSLNEETLGEMQNTVTSVLYSLLRSLAATKPKGFIVTEEWQLDALFQLTKFPKNEHVRANSLAILGLLVKHKSITSEARIFNFGQVVVSSLADSSGWVIVEALDAVFGIFDDNYPQIVEKVGLLPTLVNFLPFLQKKLAEGKGMLDPELFDKLDEACENIEPFLQYKRSQV